MVTKFIRIWASRKHAVNFWTLSLLQTITAKCPNKRTARKFWTAEKTLFVTVLRMIVYFVIDDGDIWWLWSFYSWALNSIVGSGDDVSIRGLIGPKWTLAIVKGLQVLTYLFNNSCFMLVILWPQVHHIDNTCRCRCFRLLNVDFERCCSLQLAEKSFSKQSTHISRRWMITISQRVDTRGRRWRWLLNWNCLNCWRVMVCVLGKHLRLVPSLILLILWHIGILILESYVKKSK